MKNLLQRKFILPVSAGLIATTLIIVVFVVYRNLAKDQPTTSGALTAILNEIQGTVKTLKQNQSAPELAYNGQEILVGDQVSTEDDGLVRLDLSSGTIVRIGPQSIFTLQKLEYYDNGPFTQLKMEIGELWIILKGGAIEVDTPSGVASVHGSYMHVSISKKTGEVTFTCLEGNCKVGNTVGSVDLVAGQKAVITNYSSPPKPGLMSHEDFKRWMRYNPEATLVVVPLTATVGALPEESPPVKSPDPNWCPDTTGWVSIKVQPGDTLVNLAKVHDISPSELAHANCLDLSSDLKPGTVIYLPPFLLSATPSPSARLSATSTNTLTSTPSTLFNTTTPTPTPTPPVIPSTSPTYLLTATKCTKPKGWVLYIVKAGDTLYDIALPRGTTSAELQSANCLLSTIIQIDQQLYVPPIIPTATGTPTSTYTITLTFTVTATPTETMTPTVTSTATNTSTATSTATSTSTSTSTVTNTATPN